jgi:hypothetical protein
MKYFSRNKSEIRDDFIRTNRLEVDVFVRDEKIKEKNISGQ